MANFVDPQGNIIVIDFDDVSDNEILTDLPDGSLYFLTSEGKRFDFSSLFALALLDLQNNTETPEAIGLLPSQPYDSVTFYPPNSVVTVTLGDGRVASYWTAYEIPIGGATPPAEPWTPLAIPAPNTAGTGTGTTGEIVIKTLATETAPTLIVDLTRQAHFYVRCDADKPIDITGFSKGGFALLTLYWPGGGTGFQPVVRSGVSGATLALNPAPALNVSMRGQGQTYLVRSHSTTSATLTLDPNDSPVSVEPASVTHHVNTKAVYEFRAGNPSFLRNVIAPPTTPDLFAFDPLESGAFGTYSEISPSGISFLAATTTDHINTAPVGTEADWEGPFAFTFVLINGHTITSEVGGFAISGGSYFGSVRIRTRTHTASGDKFLGLNVYDPGAPVGTVFDINNIDNTQVGTRVDPTKILNCFVVSHEGGGMWEVHNTSTGTKMVVPATGAPADKRHTGSSPTTMQWNTPLGIHLSGTLRGTSMQSRGTVSHKYAQFTPGLPAGALSATNLRSFHDSAKEAIGRLDPTGPQLGTSAY